jgi:hypothetical protein
MTTLPRTPGLCAEQIVSTVSDDGDVSNGDGDDDGDPLPALIDQWGRAHPLARTSTVGREAGQATIAVITSSVSRTHARLWCLGRDHWRIADQGSTNGTFVAGKRLAASRERDLVDGEIIQFGDVGFLFVLDAASSPARRLTESVRATAQLEPPAERGLRLIPAAGGAGVVEHGATTLQLASTQYALLELLASRRAADREASAEVRGYARSIDIIVALPWDTAHPEDNHVKQVVRRLRRALARLGLADAIEARHGLGYRLALDAEIARR